MQSFDVEATLAHDPSPGADFADSLFPKRHRFTMTVDRSAPGAPVLIVAGRGGSARVPLTAAPDGTLTYRNSSSDLLDRGTTMLEIALDARVATEQTTIDSVAYTDLMVTTRGDHVTATGQGFTRFSHTDYVGSRPFTVTLGGARDRRAPAPVLPVSTEVSLDAFGSLAVVFDEALAEGTTLAARDGTDVFPLDAIPDERPTEFVLGRVLLPFGRRLEIRAAAPLRDLAGNAGASRSIWAVTAEEPPAFAGFDGAAAGRLSGRARVVGGEVIPTLGGHRALLMDTAPGAGAAALIRLAGAPLSGMLVLRVRALARPGGGVPPLTARIARVRTTIDEWQPGVFAREEEMVPSGHPDYPLLGPAREVRHPLPGGTGDVYLHLVSYLHTGGGLAPDPGAALIEAIRLE